MSVDSPPDAVAYADTVALVTVTEDRVVPGEPQGAGGAWIDGRRGSIRIDDVVWSRSGTEQPPTTFDTQLPGWFHPQGQDEGIPMRSENGVRAEVGPTYLAPIVYLSGDWGFSDSALFEVVDDQVVASPAQRSELALALDGLSVAEAADVFEHAIPSPGAGPLDGTTAEQLKALGIAVG